MRRILVLLFLLCTVAAMADPIAELEMNRRAAPLRAWLPDARAIRALGRIQDPVAIPWLAPLARTSPDAVFALGQMWDVRAQPALLDALWHGSSAVRPLAAEALGKCADLHGIAALDAALEARDTRAAAAEALGIAAYRLHQPVAPASRIRRLAALLHDRDHAVREAASYALFRWKGEAGAALTQALHDPDPQVRINAARALAVRKLKAPALNDPDWRVRVAALEAVQSPNDVVPLFADQNPNVAIAALRCAARIGLSDDAALDDRRSPVRAEAVATWMHLHPGDRRFATDEDWRIRAAVATGLNDPDARVREASVEALKPDATAERVQALADPSESVAEAAADGLTEHPSAEAQAPLLHRLQGLRSAQSGELMSSLVGALDACHSPAAEPWLRAHLDDADAEVRRTSALALSHLLHRTIPPHLPPARPYVTPQHFSQARVETNRGVFVIQLQPDQAPGTVDNFGRLARRHFFDGLTFHRVVPNFVVQGGDPRGDGSGGPGYSIPCELNSLHYERGTVGMALAGKDTGGSQWFVTQSAQPHLNGRYTAFGQVVSGMDVVAMLQEGDRILAVTCSP